LTQSVNYPSPVWVNGYECRNCTDVDLAKKHIDPAHPKSGPFNVDAKSDPTRILQNATNQGVQSGTNQGAVSFGGQLAGISTSASSVSPAMATAVGSNLDLSV
jgi:hypothetical protein